MTRGPITMKLSPLRCLMQSDRLQLVLDVLNPGWLLSLGALGHNKELFILQAAIGDPGLQLGHLHGTKAPQIQQGHVVERCCRFQRSTGVPGTSYGPPAMLHCSDIETLLQNENPGINPCVQPRACISVMLSVARSPYTNYQPTPAADAYRHACGVDVFVDRRPGCCTCCTCACDGQCWRRCLSICSREQHSAVVNWAVIPVRSSCDTHWHKNAGSAASKGLGQPTTPQARCR